MKRRKIIRIINAFFIATFVISAFNVGKIYYDYDKADNTYKEIQGSYVVYNELFTKNVPVDEPERLVNDDSGQPAVDRTEETKDFELPITVDFEALSERNGDVIGWLYCPDTVINYPVVQGENNDQYLRRGLDGKYLVSGTLFADYRSAALGEDANYIIYGHNMKNGTMFGELGEYKSQEYFDKHPVMYYLTPNGNYRLELFAGAVVKRDDKIYLPNQSREDLFELLEEYTKKSTFKSDVEAEYNDVIVTLSTCSYDFSDARYIVIGRLTPIQLNKNTTH